MFIQTEDTPNPLALKFLPGRGVLGLGGKTLSFTAGEDAVISPLAEALLGIEGIASVMLGFDFITVTRVEAAAWENLRPRILATLMNGLSGDAPVVTGDLPETTEENETEEAIISQIRGLLEERIRPSLAQDGGDVAFVSFEEGIVTLKLKGACAGCPSAAITLRDGIERILKYYIPEIQKVVAASQGF